MIYSGMMPGELLNITKDMISFEKQQIIGGGIKTNKRKVIPIVIADFIVPVLKDLCDSFKNDKLWPFSLKEFYKEFSLMLERCKCRDILVPYSCRHTTATALALKKVPPLVMKEIMRHTKFSSTERYIDIDTSNSLDAINSLREKNN
jgi:integrase